MDGNSQWSMHIGLKRSGRLAVYLLVRGSGGRGELLAV